MLINLSNHPFTEWSETQRTAALEQFGEVVDLPFPSIDPHWSTEQVVELAKEYLQQCRDLQRTSKGAVTVHLAGEPTFCFALAALLQQAGIAVVTSTTHRKILRNSDGSISRLFEFIQFRPYPRCQDLCKEDTRR